VEAELIVESIEDMTAGVDFSALYSAHFDHLVRVAALMVGSTPVAEDIVQDAFAKLHQRLPDIAVPPAWLRTAVVNGCRNERRRMGAVRRHASQLARVRNVVSDQSNDLLESLRRLPHRQRAVIVLRFYVDLPEAEIADLLGIRLGTVKSSLHRALARMKTEVER
jgi:RNA polymerase sigma factor (sigma-70 family)